MNDIVAGMRLALRALARNKLRSGLTMLGIIIGVGAVIVMVALGQGARDKVQQQIASMGSNMLFVGSGTMNRGGFHMGMGNPQTLVIEDVRAIERECPSVALAAPGTGAGVQLVFGNDNWGTRAAGTEPQYFDIREWETTAGTVFTREDVITAANVMVIGQTVRKNLFGATDPVGQTIRAANPLYRVRGVLAAKGERAARGEDKDNIFIIPTPTLKKKTGGKNGIRYIRVGAKPAGKPFGAQQKMEPLLRDRHKIR